MGKFQIEKDTEYKGIAEKYKVRYDGKRYTVYFKPFDRCYPLVCTGDGNTENFENIKDTKLGAEMMMACHSVKNKQ